MKIARDKFNALERGDILRYLCNFLQPVEAKSLEAAKPGNCLGFTSFDISTETPSAAAELMFA
jgi:hypothetical protein